MYLARFTLDQATYVQGVVCVRFLQGDDPQLAARWRQQLRSCVNSLLISGSPYCAHRVCLSEPGILVATYLAMAPQGNDAGLRRALAAFTRLDATLPGSVELAADAAAFDVMAASFPQYRAVVEPHRHKAHNAWLSCDFRVHTVLDDLFTTACASSHSIGIQIQTAPLATPPAVLRLALRNLEDLDSTPGRPQDLLAMQRQVVGKLPSCVAVCEELLGASDPQSATWLTAFVNDRFERRYGRFKLFAPAVRFKPDGLSDVIAAGIPQLIDADARFDDLCAAGMTAAEREDLFAWVPSDAAVFNLQQPLAALESAPTGFHDRDTALARQPEGAYVFASYQHGDGERVRALLAQIETAGYPVWFDEYIPGGSEWDAVLEDRIARARAVVMFLSNRAVQSRYVRREIKFADAIGKPILCLKLEEARLEHGLAMLLLPYQMLETSGPNFRRVVAEALSLLTSV